MNLKYKRMWILLWKKKQLFTRQRSPRAVYSVVGHVSATYRSQLIGAAEIIHFFILSLKFAKCDFFNFFITFQIVKKQSAVPDPLNLLWSPEQPRRGEPLESELQQGLVSLFKTPKDQEHHVIRTTLDNLRLDRTGSRWPCKHVWAFLFPSQKSAVFYFPFS